jgi:hypothetical protein
VIDVKEKRERTRIRTEPGSHPKRMLVLTVGGTAAP